MNFNLAAPFARHAASQPEAPALVVGELRLSYGELATLARRISAWLESEARRRSGRVGILASRTVGGYAGILGATWCGVAYVPINPKAPEEHLLRILEIARLDALIVDRTGLACLSDRVLSVAPRRILTSEPASPPCPPLCELLRGPAGVYTVRSRPCRSTSP